MKVSKVEKWCGYDIRFVEINGKWMAVLKDICDALDLRAYKVSQRLDPRLLERVSIEVSDIPNRDNRSKGSNKTRNMLVVSEEGIYEALYSSRKLEAKKFRRWSAETMKRLRSMAGLKQYEVMKMTEPDVQQHINDILDTIYYDEEKKCLMRSVTVQGGDVEQVPFFDSDVLIQEANYTGYLKAVGGIDE